MIAKILLAKDRNFPSLKKSPPSEKERTLILLSLFETGKYSQAIALALDWKPPTDQRNVTVLSDLDELIRQEEQAEEEQALLSYNDLFADTLLNSLLLALDGSLF